jgi:Polyketide cyclase / dehydrase and lipid transport
VLKKILIGLVAVLALFALFVASRPESFRVERSGIVPTPPDTAFTQVNDFHAWAGWSPWEHLDPGMKKTFTGAPTGAGSVYEWEGNDKVGAGKMTLEKSERPSKLGIKLEFIKPFAGLNDTTFTFAPVPEGTKVTWAMEGKNNFVGKLFCLFMDMDKMVGGDFERGLAGLAKQAKADFDARARAEAEARIKAEQEKAAAEAKAKAEEEAAKAAAAEAAKKKGKKK